MSSNGEFSTMSSGDLPSSSIPKSLPSSREATAEGNSNSQGGFMPMREFLDRFSLPRVVRLEGSAGRPVLLCKQQQRSLRVTASLLIHRYRHDVKVAPEIVIPEGYPGWFSVVSGNGSTGGARVYRRVETLVKAGVPAFLLASPLRAYILTHSKMENGNLRAHYTKTNIRAGEVLRLVAIFQDTRRCGTSEKDQYAQCLDAHGREVFAPLLARGEFYAICQGDADQGSDAVLYRVQQLARRQLPLRVRLIAGPIPVPLPRDYSGLMQLESSTRGPIVLGCLVPDTPIYSPEMLELLVTGPEAPRVRRARLGYPSEARLLASPKMQRLLAACGRAVGDRATEPRIAPMKKMHTEEESNKLKELHLKKIKPKVESKPIIQSLREGLEHLKKSTSTNTSRSEEAVKKVEPVNPPPSTNSNSSTSQIASGILERIGKLRQVANKSRNPAKKSASFTFAVRPEIALRQHKYSSLEPADSNNQQNSANSRSHQQEKPRSKTQQQVKIEDPNSDSSKQQVQRSVSTSVLEVPQPIVELPDYSRVRDSLAPPSPPRSLLYEDELSIEECHKSDDIYAEICETSQATERKHLNRSSSGYSSENTGPESHVMARIKLIIKEEPQRSRYREDDFIMPKERKYVNSVFVSNSDGADTKNQIDYSNNDDDIIYNVIY